MLDAIINTLFPPRCFGCGALLLGDERRDRVCAFCAHTVYLIESPRCPRCALPREVRAGVDAVCGTCLTRPPAYDAVHARWVYDGAVADAVRRAKSSDDPSTLFALIDADRGWFAELAATFEDAQWTTPPVHAKDLVARGWDPARLAARRAIGRRFCDPLQKTRRSTKQARLGRDARRASLRGAFECAQPVDGEWVVFDDVMTTGATLDEAARALKRGGAKRVVCIVLGRSV